MLQCSLSAARVSSIHRPKLAPFVAHMQGLQAVRHSASGVQRELSHGRAKGLQLSCAATLPPALNKIVTGFQMVPDPKAKYQQLLYYAKKLPSLAAEHHIEANKVQGCVSQVWVIAEQAEDGKLHWSADSDSALTKGLAALLVQGLSGATPEEVLQIPPDFIETMGLKQSLTPSRNNGFLNMFRMMQKKALDILKTSSKGASGQTSPALPDAADAAASTAEPMSSSSQTSSISDSNGSGNGSGGVAGAAPRSSMPMRDSMERKLTEALSPERLLIIDESAQHAHHAGVKAMGKGAAAGETHFRVEVVSPAFEGLTAVKRHRLVYGLLRDELAGSVHALSLITRTPAEQMQDAK